MFCILCDVLFMLVYGTCVMKFVYICVYNKCDWCVTNLRSTHYKRSIYVTF